MNPRFDKELDFQPDGSLEVCGPTNLDADVNYMTITHLRIDDGSGHVEDRTGLSVVAQQTDTDWMAVLPNMKPPCVPTTPRGAEKASGHADATLTMTDGTTRPFSWDDHFTLV